MQPMQLTPIGFIRSCFPEKFGTPRQPGLVPQSEQVLELLPEVQPELSLLGLQEFSHLWLIFHFHKNLNTGFKPKVHPPRLQGQSCGVFATRSPHRPNALGLSLMKIEKIEGRMIHMSGGDLIEGTPVFDIKPYLPKVESIPQALGGWADQDLDPVEIEWDSKALQAADQWQKDSNRPLLKSLIEGLVKSDPRPVVYRGFEGSADPKYRQIHAVRLFEGDVRFQFLSPNRARVLQVLPYYLPSE